MPIGIFENISQIQNYHWGYKQMENIACTGLFSRIVVHVNKVDDFVDRVVFLRAAVRETVSCFQ